ncbi:hypothetical protein MTR67_052872, partial [Solanum verrucosum]
FLLLWVIETYLRYLPSSFSACRKVSSGGCSGIQDDFDRGVKLIESQNGGLLGFPGDQYLLFKYLEQAVVRRSSSTVTLAKEEKEHGLMWKQLFQ